MMRLCDESDDEETDEQIKFTIQYVHEPRHVDIILTMYTGKLFLQDCA